MVDIANNVPGTIGAQLAGAGMGGNIVVLVKAEAVENVVTALNDKYYVPNNIPYDAHICIPIPVLVF
jgi:galactokinase